MIGWIILGLLGPIALYLIILTFSSYIVPPDKEYEKNSRWYRFLLYSSTWICNAGCRIRYHVTGKELVPKEERFLLVCNHRSNFDPILTWWVFRKYDLAFISKESNFHVPWFGRIIRKCCFKVIDRDNPKKSMKTLMEAAELIKSQEVSVGIYPEGTRSKSCELLPFHNGVFKVAKLADAPIVVLSITGTENIHRNFPLHGTDVYINVLEVISRDDVRKLKTGEIGERVLKDISEDLTNQEGEK